MAGKPQTMLHLVLLVGLVAPIALMEAAAVVAVGLLTAEPGPLAVLVAELAVQAGLVTTVEEQVAVVAAAVVELSSLLPKVILPLMPLELSQPQPQEPVELVELDITAHLVAAVAELVMEVMVQMLPTRPGPTLPKVVVAVAELVVVSWSLSMVEPIPIAAALM